MVDNSNEIAFDEVPVIHVNYSAFYSITHPFAIDTAILLSLEINLDCQRRSVIVFSIASMAHRFSLIDLDFACTMLL